MCRTGSEYALRLVSFGGLEGPDPGPTCYFQGTGAWIRLLSFGLASHTWDGRDMSLRLGQGPLAPSC